MRLEPLLLGLIIGAAPAQPLGAAPATAPVAAQGTIPRPAPAAEPGVVAVLGPGAAGAAGCKVARGPGGELRAPLYSPETADCPIARAAGEVITLDELGEALAESHLARGSRASRGGKAKAMDFKPTLDRLIDVRLIVLEAKEMGLPEQPEYRDALEQFRSSTLRTTLQEEAAAAARPDPAEEERLYRAAVKQWKIRSVRFEAEEDARKFREAVAQGGSFEALAKAAAAAKKAQGGEPGFVPAKELVPELAKVAGALEQGQLGAPVKVGKGWVVQRLEGTRYPEGDAKARGEARAQALGEAQHRAVRAFHQALVKKYATVDEALLGALDFEAGGEAGFQALRKDARPVAQIQGEPPLTVAELTKEVGERFFHGIADPIKEHRVNPGKQDAFERLLGGRLFLREARERKLDQTDAFRRKVAGYDRVLAFNAVLERAVIPEVKVTEPEVQALYEKRKKQLTIPGMYRLDGVGFAGAAAGQAALDKLKGGTDLAWLRGNAQGRLKPEEQKLTFEGSLLSSNTLPATLVKTLAGAAPGDLRLYAADDGVQHYVVRVVEVLPPSIRPYTDLREKLAREVEAEKIAAAVRGYAAKLRKLQKVEVLITRIAG